MWFDSHCHLQYEPVPPDAVETAVAAGVARMICVGTDVALSARAVEVATSHAGHVWATVGVHPHDAAEGITGLDALADDERVVAIGECGLDYHYDHSPRPVQRQVFADQVALAAERRMALVVHTRDAWDDTFAILGADSRPERIVLHCFTGGPAEARRALDLGAWLSFSGIVTFKGADEIRAAAALAPLDRILVETDAPYLTPVPHRGAPNAPAFVTLVGAAVAAARGVSSRLVEDATWSNTHRVFGLNENPASSG